MALRGKTPIQEEMRLKAFIYGPPGVGKTLAALQFPNSYIIDTAKETSRYWKQIQTTNSEVFHCSDFLEIIKEVKILRDEKHRFQTLILDEITTLYQNIQRIWTDKFTNAQQSRGKTSPSDLLEDFGFRYWDKVKRDWYYFIDLIRQLDMNVIINAQQKNEYGSNQQIVGVTNDSDKKDRHVFDFVFRLIIRGKEYKAITAKQRVLPLELDPEAKRFPKEFDWNYQNLLKFYYKEYIEKPTKNSQLNDSLNTPSFQNDKAFEHFKEAKKRIIPDNTEKKDSKKESKQPKKEEFKKEEKLKKTPNNIDKIKELLKEEEISIKDFKTFLQDTCKWKHVSILTKLSNKEQDILLNNWNDKIIPELKKTIKSSSATEKEETEKQTCAFAISGPEEKVTTSKTTGISKQEESELQYEPNKPIREDQKQKILIALCKKDITVERFLKGFTIEKWEEINQEGANNMIKNIDVMIGALE